MTTLSTIKKQKEAWNKMTEKVVKAAGGTRGLPMHLKKPKKKVTRLRKARQNRRWVAYSGLDGLERAVACRLEHLELTNYDDDKSYNEGNEEDDDEYNLENDRLDGPVKKKMKRTSDSRKKHNKKDRKLQRFTSLEKVNISFASLSLRIYYIHICTKHRCSFIFMQTRVRESVQDILLQQQSLHVHQIDTFVP